jgi:CRP-like cAMP-binding protein
VKKITSDIFRAHLEKFIDINEEEFSAVLAFFEVKKVKKKENLLTEGQICKSHYFVLNGCLRKFFINGKGIEQTTEFAIENWWITDNLAYERNLPTEFYIQAVENSEILTIDSHQQEQLVIRHPKMERYFRFIYQRAYAASQIRIKYLYDFSKEEFYHHLCKTHPEFVQRIPQYLIASFLGFTPEYLSEIRNKIRS